MRTGRVRFRGLPPLPVQVRAPDRGQHFTLSMTHLVSLAVVADSAASVLSER